MDLSARDIHDKQFHDAWRGYNQEEVDDFLDRVAESLDRLHRENESLHGRIRELDQTMAASRDTEEMLKKTLITAQRAAEEAIAKAKAKAEELVTHATNRARRTEEEARERTQAAEEATRAQTKTVEEETRRKAQAFEQELAARRKDLDERIEQLRGFQSDARRRLRAFFEQQLKALDALTDVEPPKFPPVPRPAAGVRPQATPARPAEGRAPSEEAESDEDDARGGRDLFFRQQG